MLGSNSRELSIVLKLQDQVSSELKGVQGKLESMRPTFRRMAVGGTAAFTAITGAVGLAVREAGKAEKIGENFETTFGESSDALRAFIQDFGSEFAFVERELGRGATSIGFQLNNMGDIGAEEGQRITESMLTAAGGLSDFFGEQMSVEQASDAMAKGLAGNREQLQMMGFSAYADDIKEMAASMGFNTEELTKSQEALALTEIIMRETQGSVQGMKDDTDSYARMQRELRTATIEMTQVFGDVFLPMATDLLEAITPIIQRIGEWIEENPELTKNLIIAAGAISGFVAVAGGVGLLLLAISKPALILTGVIAGLAAVGWFVAKNWEKIKDRLSDMWTSITEHPFVQVMWVKLRNAVNNLKPAFKLFLDSVLSIWDSMKKLWAVIEPVLLPVLKILAAFVGMTLVAAFQTVAAFIGGLIVVFAGLAKVIEAWAEIVSHSVGKVVDFFKWLWDILFGNSIIPDMVQGFKDAWASIVGVFDWAHDKIMSFLNPIIETAQKAIDLARRAREMAGGAVSGARDKTSDIRRRMGSGLNLIGETIGVRDAVITPQGKVIQTDPADYIMATKNPQNLAGGGGGVTIIVQDNTFMGEDDMAERVGNRILHIVKQTTKI